MKEQLITFETAKLARAKGYDVPDLLNYDLKGKLASTSEFTQSFDTDKYYLPFRRQVRGLGYLAPTQGLLHKWVRERCKLFVSVYPLSLGWAYDIRKIKQPTPSLTSTVEGFDSFEEALEDGLQQTLINHI